MIVWVSPSLEESGYGQGWVRRMVGVCRCVGPPIGLPRAVFLFRGLGRGRAYVLARMVLIWVDVSRPRRTAWTFAHELRHLAQPPEWSRRRKEADASRFADWVLEMLTKEGE